MNEASFIKLTFSSKIVTKTHAAQKSEYMKNFCLYSLRILAGFPIFECVNATSKRLAKHPSQL